MEEINLVRPYNLVNDIIFIEGSSRTGKFLLGNYFGAMQGIDHIQYNPLIEQVLWLTKIGHLNKDSAFALIKTQVDMNCYERFIGRNLNFRHSDKSSIYNSPDTRKYIKRCSSKDGDIAVENMQNEKPVFPFIVHETLQNIKMLLFAFPKSKIIRLERHPVDLAYSWYKRGWGKRHKDDPKSFGLLIDGEKEPVPWYAYNWYKEYQNCNEIDKIIKSLYYIDKLGKEEYQSLSDIDKNKIFISTYERLVTLADEEVPRISRFLERPLLPEFKVVRARENNVRPLRNNAREERLKFLKQNSSEEGFEILKKMIVNYEERWGNLHSQ